jgi:TolB-like protein
VRVINVFISKERASDAFAHRVAHALREEGFEVWTDAELPPHRAYSEVIQERLAAADAVVVLWSEAAGQSQWVRAEAEYARTQGKLVQVILDDSLPPMPFNQTQCASLKGWTGDRRNAQWRKVLQSLTELAEARGASQAAPPSRVAGPVAPGAPAATDPGVRLVAGVAVSLLVVAALGAGAWWLSHRPSSAPSGLKVAVLPFAALSSGQEVRYFADSLQDEIVGTLSASQIAPVSANMSSALRGPDAATAIDRLGVRLVLDGTAGRAGNMLRARVHLDDPHKHVTLWSREFEAPAEEAAVLQSRVAHRIFVVLGCSRAALEPKGGLSDPSLLSRYLRACDSFADWDVHTGYDRRGLAEFSETQRLLIAQAPDFVPAQFTYAITAAISAKAASPDAAAGLRREAEKSISRGLALAPKSPMASAARSLLAPQDHWGQREAFLRQAVADGPAHPLANFWLGAFLAETGRLREAVEFTRRSTAGDQVYDWGIFHSIIDCEVEQPDRAAKEIGAFRALMPNSLFGQDMQVLCLAFGGEWGAARAVLAGLPQPRPETPMQGRAAQALLAAATTRAPADIERARGLALTQADQGPVARVYAIAFLSALGNVDDAFVVADGFDPNVSPDNNPGILLFSPLTASRRRDPRFMRLAARIGLVDYWRTSGHWPDFCADRTLPYACSAEAAKYPRRPPA